MVLTLCLERMETETYTHVQWVCRGEMGGQCQDFCFFFYKKENRVRKHTCTRSTLTHARHGSETPKIELHIVDKERAKAWGVCESSCA